MFETLYADDNDTTIRDGFDVAAATASVADSIACMRVGGLQLSMDVVFELDEGARSNFIRIMMQSLGSAYACLWSFSTPSSCLFFLDGLSREEGNVQSNALFDLYKQSLFVIEPAHGHVPGLAFRNNSPYVEAREDQLLTLASNGIQRQFYQEARIKIVIFMGCRSGEIELGFSDAPPEDMEMQMMSIFPNDFSRRLPIRKPLIPAAENLNAPPPSSSSSSLRSPVMDSHSPEYSSLLFNLNAATASSSSHPLLLTTPSTIPATTDVAFLELLARFPTAESEHAMMTSAFLTVNTSPSVSSTLHQLQQNQQQQQQQRPRENLRPSAFARYTTAHFKPSGSHGHSFLKRLIAYCRSMNLIRLRERLQGAAAGLGGGRPISSTQVHHMMSERKRREKLNESYRSLKTLLPPGTKKYKAAMLATTREYLTSLRSQVEDLLRMNAVLEAQSLPPPSKEAAPTTTDESAASSSHVEQGTSRPVEVRVRTVSDSASTSSQDRTVDMRVVVRGHVPTLDLVIRILEFLKQVRNVHVLSIEADARVTRRHGVENHLYLRLHVEGEEWEEYAFQEAVRRLVADFSQ